MSSAFRTGGHLARFAEHSRVVLSLQVPFFPPSAYVSIHQHTSASRGSLSELSYTDTKDETLVRIIWRFTGVPPPDILLWTTPLDKMWVLDPNKTFDENDIISTCDIRVERIGTGNRSLSTLNENRKVISAP